MRRSIPLLLVAAASAVGCAAPMALQPGATSLDMGQDGMVLFSTHVANTYKDYEVRAKSVAVQRVASEADKAKIAAARAAASPLDAPIDDGTGVRLFAVSAPTGSGGAPGSSWEQRLVILRLPPGQWETVHVNLEAGGFPISGIGWARVRAPFQVTQGTVSYLGRISATRRERKGNDPMAGPPIPLIDQAVTGFSGGTVDVKVIDAFDADLDAAGRIYPALRTVELVKAVMTPIPPAP
jgi:hypothetical protein